MVVTVSTKRSSYRNVALVLLVDVAGPIHLLYAQRLLICQIISFIICWFDSGTSQWLVVFRVSFRGSSPSCNAGFVCALLLRLAVYRASVQNLRVFLSFYGAVRLLLLFVLCLLRELWNFKRKRETLSVRSTILVSVNYRLSRFVSKLRK